MVTFKRLGSKAFVQVNFAAGDPETQRHRQRGRESEHMQALDKYFISDHPHHQCISFTSFVKEEMHAVPVLLALPHCWQGPVRARAHPRNHKTFGVQQSYMNFAFGEVLGYIGVIV